MIFPQTQWHQSNNTKSDEFANHTFFRDGLYIKSKSISERAYLAENGDFQPLGPIRLNCRIF